MIDFDFDDIIEWDCTIQCWQYGFDLHFAKKITDELLSDIHTICEKYPSIKLRNNIIGEWVKPHFNPIILHDDITLIPKEYPNVINEESDKPLPNLSVLRFTVTDNWNVFKVVEKVAQLLKNKHQMRVTFTGTKYQEYLLNGY